MDTNKTDTRADELAELFIVNGLSKNAARILALFEENDELTALEIQAMARLQQPQVSVAVQDLRGRGWVARQAVPHGQGKPRDIYTLARPFREIVQEIVNARALELKTLENKMLDLMGAVA